MVKLIRFEQCASSEFACAVFTIQNHSDRVLQFWNIKAALFDVHGEFLSLDYTVGNNLRAGQTDTAKIIYRNVRAAEIASWKPRIDSVTVYAGDNWVDATRVFELVEQH